MIRLRDLRIRTKRAVTFAAVLLPLLATEALAVWSFRRSLRESAEVELSNTVDHLVRLCAAQRERALAAGASGAAPRVEDLAYLREVIRSFRVGLTGYAYAMNEQGVLLVHPSQEGRSILDSRDTDGVEFIRRITERAPRLGPGETGTIRYPWQNVELGDREPRMKILKYRYFAPWGWILAAGSYEEEIYAAVGEFEEYAMPLAAASVVLVVVLETLFALMFLARRQSTSASMRPIDWLSTVAGTFLPLLLRPTSRPDLIPAEAVQAVGVGFGVVALLSLNRSVGLLPANRGVRSAGAYRLVRHPLYCSYVFNVTGYVWTHLTPVNVAVATAGVVAQVVRIHREEKLLSRDPGYVAYMARTRWRLIPYVY